MNRIILTWILCIGVMVATAQNKDLLPLLSGTWHQDDPMNVEHWDLLHATSLKGTSYQMVEGKIRVTEYLNLSIINQNLIYTATVIGQNEGKDIVFKAVPAKDKQLIFENLKHDFPKRIIYHFLNDSIISVTLSDNKNKIIHYKLFKQMEHSTIPNEQIGAFSISLNVKDIHASKAFYEKLGFVYKNGNIDQKWLVLKNGTSVIGLFEGMFPKNMLTFNPGWDQSAQNITEFKDIRTLQEDYKAKGLTIEQPIDEANMTGPASFFLTDPDGNPILFDQHR